MNNNKTKFHTLAIKLLTMKVVESNCDHETIQFSNNIQDFGYLIVFDDDANCIAISDNCTDWIGADASSLLNNTLDYFLTLIPSKQKIAIQQSDFDRIKTNPETYQVTINKLNYHLTIYINEGHVFFEFEKNNSTSINFNQLNEFQHRLNLTDNIWQNLCDNIHQITNTDRTMVYQFLEDGNGMVICENSNISDSTTGYRYPEYDIPFQDRELYTKHQFRQTDNVQKEISPLHCAENCKIDLSKSNIRSLSSLHIQYLENVGIKASAIFSIIIDGQLWGLVTCQHFSPKFITSELRSLCLFAIQHTANRHLVNQQRIEINQNKRIQAMELDLKEKLLYTQSFENTLSLFAEDFTQILSADGFMIKSNDYIFCHGQTPDNQNIDTIEQEINRVIGQENIFTNDKFNLQNSIDFDFPGIARLSFEKNYSLKLYWFRKEQTIKDISSNNNEGQFSKENTVNSTKTPFNIWKNEIKGQSKKWGTFDQFVLKSILKLIQDSIINKMTEIKELNGKLIEINSTLETFTHELGHDLKNPLSVIRTCAQMLNRYQEMPKEKMTKFTTNIIEATTLINDIINKTLESSRTTNKYIYKGETIFTEGFINQIIQQALENYQVENHKIKLGKLLPIYSEKTLLYQLFMNLINNAIKFSSKQELTILEIYSEEENDKITYYIKDNGIGIPEDEIRDLFKIYKRLTNSKQYEGTGIGLSIVKRIVDKLNAQISVDSEINKGTTFKISFVK